MQANEERKAAYIAAVKESGMNKCQLSFLHKVSESVIEKWLYVDRRYPTFQACYELIQVMRRLNLKCPALARIINRSSNRATDYLKKYHPDLGTYKNIKYVTRLGKNEYFFHGEKLPLSKIAEKIGVTYQQLYNRLKYHASKGKFSAEQNSDITGIENINPRGANRKPTMFIYHGEALSLEDIARKNGMDKNALYHLIRRKKLSGMDVTPETDLKVMDAAIQARKKTIEGRKK